MLDTTTVSLILGILVLFAFIVGAAVLVIAVDVHRLVNRMAPPPMGPRMPPPPQVPRYPQAPPPSVPPGGYAPR